MGNEFEECQSVSKLFKQIKDWSMTFDMEIAPDDRLQPEAMHLTASITDVDSWKTRWCIYKVVIVQLEMHLRPCK